MKLFDSKFSEPFLQQEEQSLVRGSKEKSKHIENPETYKNKGKEQLAALPDQWYQDHRAERWLNQAEEHFKKAFHLSNDKDAESAFYLVAIKYNQGAYQKAEEYLKLAAALEKKTIVDQYFISNESLVLLAFQLTMSKLHGNLDKMYASYQRIQSRTSQPEPEIILKNFKLRPLDTFDEDRKSMVLSKIFKLFDRYGAEVIKDKPTRSKIPLWVRANMISYAFEIGDYHKAQSMASTEMAKASNEKFGYYYAKLHLMHAKSIIAQGNPMMGFYTLGQFLQGSEPCIENQKSLYREDILDSEMHLLRAFTALRAHQDRNKSFWKPTKQELESVLNEVRKVMTLKEKGYYIDYEGREMSLEQIQSLERSLQKALGRDAVYQQVLEKAKKHVLVGDFRSSYDVLGNYLAEKASYQDQEIHTLRTISILRAYESQTNSLWKPTMLELEEAQQHVHIGLDLNRQADDQTIAERNKTSLKLLSLRQKLNTICGKVTDLKHDKFQTDSLLSGNLELNIEYATQILKDCVENGYKGSPELHAALSSVNRAIVLTKQTEDLEPTYQDQQIANLLVLRASIHSIMKNFGSAVQDMKQTFVLGQSNPERMSALEGLRLLAKQDKTQNTTSLKRFAPTENLHKRSRESEKGLCI